MIESEFAKYLDNQNILTFDETGTSGDTFINTLPPEPDDAIGIFAEGGPTPSIKFIEDTVDIQFLVRGGFDPRPAKSTAQDIYDELQGKDKFALPDGTEVIKVAAVQSAPIHIGRDDNNRHKYSLNFRIEYENSTTNRSDK